jgi:hypothetical protein
MQEVYLVKSTCRGEQLYLARNENTGIIEEICIQSLTNPVDVLKLTSMKKEEVIPIAKEYFIYIDISNEEF